MDLYVFGYQKFCHQFKPTLSKHGIRIEDEVPKFDVGLSELGDEMREDSMAGDPHRSRHHRYDTRRRRGSDNVTTSTMPRGSETMDTTRDLHKDFQRVFSFSYDLPTLQREPTDLRLAKHQPLPAIGMTSLPENLDEDLLSVDKNEMNQQSSRFIQPPSPEFIVPPKRQNRVVELEDSPKSRRTKVKINTNVKRKRFEQRRLTAGVQLPPLQRRTRQWPQGRVSDSFDSDYISEIPERPDAPLPNRTPPLAGGKLSPNDEDEDSEPIDYIDED